MLHIYGWLPKNTSTWHICLTTLIQVQAASLWPPTTTWLFIWIITKHASWNEAESNEKHKYLQHRYGSLPSILKQKFTYFNSTSTFPKAHSPSTFRTAAVMRRCLPHPAIQNTWNVPSPILGLHTQQLMIHLCFILLYYSACTESVSCFIHLYKYIAAHVLAGWLNRPLPVSVALLYGTQNTHWQRQYFKTTLLTSLWPTSKAYQILLFYRSCNLFCSQGMITFTQAVDMTNNCMCQKCDSFEFFSCNLLIFTSSFR